MTLSERRARLLALELEHAEKKAANRRARLARTGGPYPWTLTDIARLYTAIRDERDAIVKLEAAIGPTPKRATVIGNGWALVDDVTRGLIVLELDIGKVKLTRRLMFALRGERFLLSKEVGYSQARSGEAWTKGLRLGRAIEEGMGERPPDRTTESDSTAK